MSMQLYGNKAIIIEYPSSEVPLINHKFINKNSKGKKVGGFYAGEQTDKKRMAIDEFFRNFENGPIEIYNDPVMMRNFKKEFDSIVIGNEDMFIDNLAGYKSNIYKFIENDNIILGTAYYGNSKKYLKLPFFKSSNLDELIYESISLLVIDKRDDRYYAYLMLRNDVKSIIENKKAIQ